ncbi:MAG: extracellular solute-binding protein [Dorea sp.]|nr:extracellular solute-binding protein [Dorea sp.]
MKRNVVTRIIAASLSVVMVATMLTGCRFGFASDPDDPNETEEEIPIDTSVDTFQYDSSLEGTEITLLNSKAEIQVALEKMSEIFEEKSGVHVEVMPITDGDSPYTKVVSLYNSGTPPTLSILDTTDVIALAEEKAADLSEEAWTAEAEGYLTKINGKVYSFPLCIEGRGLIYNKKVIEDLKDGKMNLDTYDRMDQFLDMFDVLKKYNVAKGDPLGADYDEMAIDLVDGKTAFWFNGNWAWPNLEEAGAEEDDEYGFLPYFMNNDPDDFCE